MTGFSKLCYVPLARVFLDNEINFLEAHLHVAPTKYTVDLTRAATKSSNASFS